MADYRCALYSKPLSNIHRKKQELLSQIRKEHPKVDKVHDIIKQNESKWKNQFMSIYNRRCAYCGLSTDIVSSMYMYEIDHYICQSGSYAKKHEDVVHSIDNLKLACKRCNMKKLGFELSEDMMAILDPDKKKITDVFERNKQFYIVISDRYSKNKEVADFYKRLDLGNELFRIDYLVQSIFDLKQKTKNSEIYKDLDMILTILKSKRNYLG